MSIQRFKKQNYNKLKSQCVNRGQLFTDPTFTADANSLFKTKRIDCEWKRPHDIVHDPKLCVDGTGAHDVLQGQLGNCWFVAASSVLTSNNSSWEMVIPDLKKQERTHKNSYAGIYKFRFWQFGHWIEVVIDDLLPTINGRLIFAHSSTKNEFWSSLLEKAYAKLNGCYEHLVGGSLSEALQDFTGGVCETIILNKIHGKNKSKNSHDAHFETLKKAYERGSLQTAAINAGGFIEEKMACGLIKGHAYGITKLNTMRISENKFFSFISSTNDEKLHMIRLRNPWGSNEWNGTWSDKSEHWNRVPEKERVRMGLNFDEDGEFWMEFNDFLYYFDEVSICRIINTSMLSIRKTWHESLIKSEWSLPNLAGGCVNNRDTFCHNPQFMFEINHNDVQFKNLLLLPELLPELPTKLKELNTLSELKLMLNNTLKKIKTSLPSEDKLKLKEDSTENLNPKLFSLLELEVSTNYTLMLKKF